MTGHIAEIPISTPSLHGLSQTLEGFPHSVLQPYFMPQPLIGFSLFKAFPLLRTLPGSSPGDTLSAFLRQPPPPFENDCFSHRPRPQGFVSAQGPESVLGVLHPSSSRCPLELHHSHGIRHSGLESCPHDSSAHSLNMQSLQAHSACRLSAFSLQGVRHLSFS